MKMQSVAVVMASLAACGLWAQNVAPGKVSIESVNGLIELQITNQAALQDVVASFCQKTQTQCEGVSNTAGIMVAPMQIRAHWNEVVARLLDGTRLDYVATEPASGGAKGMLLIQSRGAEAAQPAVAAAAAAPEAPTFSEEPSSGPAVATAQVQAEEQQPQSSAANEPRAEAPNFGTAMPGGASMAGIGGSPLTSNMESNGQTQDQAYLPFPDSHGNPIPVRNESPQYLPFPDSQGRPIPVNPNAPQGSPFPVEAIQQAQQQPR